MTTRFTILIATILAAFGGLLLGSTANAGQLQASGGITTLRGTAPVLQLEYKWAEHESYHTDGALHLETGLTVIGESDHHHGFSQFQGHQAVNYFGDTTLVVQAARVQLGAGVAYGHQTDAYNSEGLNFRLLAGYQHGHFHLAWNHFSNAGLKHPNMGRDMILAGWDL